MVPRNSPAPIPIAIPVSVLSNATPKDVPRALFENFFFQKVPLTICIYIAIKLQSSYSPSTILLLLESCHQGSEH